MPAELCIRRVGTMQRQETECAHLLSHRHPPATAYPGAGGGGRAAAFDTICVGSRSDARREMPSCAYGSGGYSMALASVSLSGDFEIDCAILIIDARILAVAGGSWSLEGLGRVGPRKLRRRWSEIKMCTGYLMKDRRPPLTGIVPQGASPTPASSATPTQNPPMP